MNIEYHTGEYALLGGMAGGGHVHACARMKLHYAAFTTGTGIYVK